MADPNRALQDALLCLTGFVVGACVAAEITNVPHGNHQAPRKIDWLFDNDPKMSRHVTADQPRQSLTRGMAQ
ncbi:MAG: hypothetical protein K5905_00215 [Roseibium sp.]|uniref:hypothetical protein n=1 Tax=Roseibium sp. TaxID=1936156 RepID=UPI002618B349|nr:hypothetical protein [Roseibium sp.]MCV0423873.1 hypothetical protein [Roseibium sp.]